MPHSPSRTNPRMRVSTRWGACKQACHLSRQRRFSDPRRGRVHSNGDGHLRGEEIAELSDGQEGDSEGDQEEKAGGRYEEARSPSALDGERVDEPEDAAVEGDHGGCHEGAHPPVAAPRTAGPLRRARPRKLAARTWAIALRERRRRGAAVVRVPERPSGVVPRKWSQSCRPDSSERGVRAAGSDRGVEDATAYPVRAAASGATRGARLILGANPGSGTSRVCGCRRWVEQADRRRAALCLKPWSTITARGTFLRKVVNEEATPRFVAGLHNAATRFAASGVRRAGCALSRAARNPLPRLCANSRPGRSQPPNHPSETQRAGLPR